MIKIPKVGQRVRVSRVVEGVVKSFYSNGVLLETAVGTVAARLDKHSTVEVLLDLLPTEPGTVLSAVVASESGTRRCVLTLDGDGLWGTLVGGGLDWHRPAELSDWWVIDINARHEVYR